MTEADLYSHWSGCAIGLRGGCVTCGAIAAGKLERNGDEVRRMRRRLDTYEPNADALVYLACPYSDPNPDVMRARFEAVNLEAARLFANDVLVFSPISHTHPIALADGLPTGFDFWERYDRAILRRCSALYVLKLDGWHRSVGVRREIEIAREFGIEIVYIEPSSHERLSPLVYGKRSNEGR